jgi:putative membrane protein
MQTLATAATTLADHWDGPAPWWPLIPLFWFALFIALFFVAARFGWWGRRRWQAERSQAYGARAGKARLAERFASGEIDEQEYRARLAVLDETSEEGDRR